MSASTLAAVQAMPWTYDDGGRAAAGYRGETRDCVARAVAIVTLMPYRDVYDLINELAQAERPRNGGTACTRITGGTPATGPRTRSHTRMPPTPCRRGPARSGTCSSAGESGSGEPSTGAGCRSSW